LTRKANDCGAHRLGYTDGELSASELPLGPRIAMSPDAPSPERDDTVRVFVSYAREDRHWLDEKQRFQLIPFLADSLRRYRVSFWFDRELKAGDEYKREIDAEIDHSQIAILLVSQAFLNSEFIETREMPRIHERAGRGEMIVIPVLVERCRWQDYAFLADRQMVPNEPLIKYTRDWAEWSEVRAMILDDLKAQVDKVRRQRKAGGQQAKAEAEQAGTERRRLHEAEELTKPVTKADGSGTGRYPENAHWTDYGDGTDYPPLQAEGSGHADGSGTERYSSNEIRWTKYNDRPGNPPPPGGLIKLTDGSRTQRPLTDYSLYQIVVKKTPFWSVTAKAQRCLDLTVFRELFEDYWNGNKTLPKTQSDFVLAISKLRVVVGWCEPHNKYELACAVREAGETLFAHLHLIFCIARKAKGSNPPPYANPAAFEKWFDLLDGEADKFYWIPLGVTDRDELVRLTPKLEIAFPSFTPSYPYGVPPFDTLFGG
jgi:hypothetical protein